MVQTQFRYSIAEYESAIANFRWGNQALPDCLQMKLGRDYNRIAEGWDDAGLESKISHAAMLIGGYVPNGGAENLSLVITHGYEMRSEEHTSELQSLMRTSYAVLCLQKKQKKTN